MITLSLSHCTSLLFNVFFLTFWSINSNIRSTVHAQSVHGIFTFSFLAWNIRSEFLFSHKFQNVKFNWAGLDWNNWFHDEFWILTPVHCVPTNWSKETNINWGYFHFIMRLTSPIKQYSVGRYTHIYLQLRFSNKAGLCSLVSVYKFNIRLSSFVYEVMKHCHCKHLH